MTAQTMSIRCEIACKDHSTEKAQELVTQQNDLCCFIDLPFTLYIKLVFLQLYMLFLESSFSMNTQFVKNSTFTRSGAINLLFAPNLSCY